MLFVLTAVLALGGSTADTTPVEWGTATNNVQFSISLKDGRTTLKPNEPVHVSIQARNLSLKDTIWFWTFCENWAEVYQDAWSVISPSGHELTPKGERKLFPASSGDMKRVRPLETHRYQFDVGRVFNFDEPGGYTITLNKPVWIWPKEGSTNATKRFVVVSNPLRVSIVSTNGDSKKREP